MIKNTTIVIGYLMILLIMSSCKKTNTIKPNTSYSNWKQIPVWSFKGKMAINDGNNSGSGRIDWHQAKDLLTANFKAPLGQGSWTIKEQANIAQLTSSENGSSSAENAELLISNELGWYFPWNKIKYWLRGYSSETENLNHHEILPTTIIDSGWKITFQQWTKSDIGFLPRKIKASLPPYSVKIIIYDWKL
jgi:outer membrane lipoprotein LolB